MKKFFLRLKELLIIFSKFINSIVNFILLIPVFFIGVGITSLLSKLFGKSFLDTKFKNKKSYWIKRKLTTQSIDKYYRMF